jgi:hypothetical protein
MMETHLHVDIDETSAIPAAAAAAAVLGPAVNPMGAVVPVPGPGSDADVDSADTCLIHDTSISTKLVALTHYHSPTHGSILLPASDFETDVIELPLSQQVVHTTPSQSEAVATAASKRPRHGRPSVVAATTKSSTISSAGHRHRSQSYLHNAESPLTGFLHTESKALRRSQSEFIKSPSRSTKTFASANSGLSQLVSSASSSPPAVRSATLNALHRREQKQKKHIGIAIRKSAPHTRSMGALHTRNDLPSRKIAHLSDGPLTAAEQCPIGAQYASFRYSIDDSDPLAPYAPKLHRKGRPTSTLRTDTMRFEDDSNMVRKQQNRRSMRRSRSPPIPRVAISRQLNSSASLPALPSARLQRQDTPDGKLGRRVMLIRSRLDKIRKEPNAQRNEEPALRVLEWMKSLKEEQHAAHHAAGEWTVGDMRGRNDSVRIQAAEFGTDPSTLPKNQARVAAQALQSISNQLSGRVAHVFKPLVEQVLFAVFDTSNAEFLASRLDDEYVQYTKMSKEKRRRMRAKAKARAKAKTLANAAEQHVRDCEKRRLERDEDEITDDEEDEFADGKQPNLGYHSGESDLDDDDDDISLMDSDSSIESISEPVEENAGDLTVMETYKALTRKRDTERKHFVRELDIRQTQLDKLRVASKTRMQVLHTAVDKWQENAATLAFRLWRRNTFVIRYQRRALDTLLQRWQKPLLEGSARLNFVYLRSVGLWIQRARMMKRLERVKNKGRALQAELDVADEATAKLRDSINEATKVLNDRRSIVAQLNEQLQLSLSFEQFMRNFGPAQIARLLASTIIDGVALSLKQLQTVHSNYPTPELMRSESSPPTDSGLSSALYFDPRSMLAVQGIHKEEQAQHLIMHMEPDALVLCWMNYQLAMSGTERRVENFELDMRDSECIARVLNRTNPRRATARNNRSLHSSSATVPKVSMRKLLVEAVDLEMRARLLLRVSKKADAVIGDAGSKEIAAVHTLLHPRDVVAALHPDIIAAWMGLQFLHRFDQAQRNEASLGSQSSDTSGASIQSQFAREDTALRQRLLECRNETESLIRSVRAQINMNANNRPISVEWATGVVTNFITLQQQVQRFLIRVDTAHQTTRVIHTRVRAFVTSVLYQRYLGKPMRLPNYRERRETLRVVSHITSLTQSWRENGNHYLQPADCKVELPHDDHSLRALLRVVLHHIKPLRNVYLHYAVGTTVEDGLGDDDGADDGFAAASTLSLDEYAQFCTDCVLTSGARVSEAAIKELQAAKAALIAKRHARLRRAADDKNSSSTSSLFSDTSGVTHESDLQNWKKARPLSARWLVYLYERTVVVFAGAEQKTQDKSGGSTDTSSKSSSSVFSDTSRHNDLDGIFAGLLQTHARKTVNKSRHSPLSHGIEEYEPSPKIAELVMDFPLFVAHLVHLCVFRYPGIGCLDVKFSEFLRNDVLLCAGQFDIASFHKLQRETRALEAHKSYGQKLRKIFLFYATSMSSVADEAAAAAAAAAAAEAAASRGNKSRPSKWENTVDIDEFLSVVQDCGLLRSAHDEHVLRSQTIAEDDTNDESDASGSGKADSDASHDVFGMFTGSSDSTARSKPKPAAAAAAAASLKLPRQRNNPSAASNRSSNRSANTSQKLAVENQLTEQDVRTVFTNVQMHHLFDGSAADRNASLDEDQEGVLTYAEFLEALTALACYRYPDPYTPVEQRFTKFLECDFFPALRRKVQMGAIGQSSAVRNLIW